MRLAYHEWGSGPPLLALHGHFGHVIEFPGAGHAIHDDDPEGLALAVASFLAAL
jgi:pimeloyl-ACP methyl ester carboxylesterase